MSLKRVFLVAILLELLVVVAFAAPKQYGYISLTSPFQNRYLQAHTDGETHASNDTRHNEETWLLVEIDSSQHIFALRNARNGKYLSVQEADCVRANRDVVGPWEKWYFEKAATNSSDSRYFLRSFRTDFPGYLGTNPPGKDHSCGGEVHYTRTKDTAWTVTEEPNDGGTGSLVDLGDIVSIGLTLAQILGF